MSVIEISSGSGSGDESSEDWSKGGTEEEEEEEQNEEELQEKEPVDELPGFAVEDDGEIQDKPEIGEKSSFRFSAVMSTDFKALVENKNTASSGNAAGFAAGFGAASSAGVAKAIEVENKGPSRFSFGRATKGFGFGTSTDNQTQQQVEPSRVKESENAEFSQRVPAPTLTSRATPNTLDATINASIGDAGAIPGLSPLPGDGRPAAAAPEEDHNREISKWPENTAVGTKVKGSFETTTADVQPPAAKARRGEERAHDGGVSTATVRKVTAREMVNVESNTVPEPIFSHFDPKLLEGKGIHRAEGNALHLNHLNMIQECVSANTRSLETFGNYDELVTQKALAAADAEAATKASEAITSETKRLLSTVLAKATSDEEKLQSENQQLKKLLGARDNQVQELKTLKMRLEEENRQLLVAKETEIKMLVAANKKIENLGSTQRPAGRGTALLLPSGESGRLSTIADPKSKQSTIIPMGDETLLADKTLNESSAPLDDEETAAVDLKTTEIPTSGGRTTNVLEEYFCAESEKNRQIVAALLPIHDEIMAVAASEGCPFTSDMTPESGSGAHALKVFNRVYADLLKQRSKVRHQEDKKQQEWKKRRQSGETVETGVPTSFPSGGEAERPPATIVFESVTMRQKVQTLEAQKAHLEQELETAKQKLSHAMSNSQSLTNYTVTESFRTAILKSQIVESLLGLVSVDPILSTKNSTENSVDVKVQIKKDITAVVRCYIKPASSLATPLAQQQLSAKPAEVLSVEGDLAQSSLPTSTSLPLMLQSLFGLPPASSADPTTFSGKGTAGSFALDKEDEVNHADRPVEEEAQGRELEDEDQTTTTDFFGQNAMQDEEREKSVKTGEDLTGGVINEPSSEITEELEMGLAKTKSVTVIDEVVGGEVFTAVKNSVDLKEDDEVPEDAEIVASDAASEIAQGTREGSVSRQDTAASRILKPVFGASPLSVGFTSSFPTGNNSTGGSPVLNSDQAPQVVQPREETKSGSNVVENDEGLPTTFASPRAAQFKEGFGATPAGDLTIVKQHPVESLKSESKASGFGSGFLSAKKSDLSTSTSFTTNLQQSPAETHPPAPTPTPSSTFKLPQKEQPPTTQPPTSVSGGGFTAGSSSSGGFGGFGRLNSAPASKPVSPTADGAPFFGAGGKQAPATFTFGKAPGFGGFGATAAAAAGGGSAFSAAKSGTTLTFGSSSTAPPSGFGFSTSKSSEAKKQEESKTSEVAEEDDEENEEDNAFNESW